MASERVTVCASLRVKKDGLEAFMEAAKRVAALSRKEPGCLRYDFLRDVMDSHKFCFVEVYSDAGAFASHRAMPYMEDFRRARELAVEEYLGVSELRETLAR